MGLSEGWCGRCSDPGCEGPKAPCAFIVDTWALKYLHRDPFQA